MYGVNCLICYRFSVKCKKIMALQNGLPQRGWLGHISRGRLGKRSNLSHHVGPNVSMIFFPNK